MRSEEPADVYPFTEDRPFGETLLGGTPRGPTLDDLTVLPPLFTPRRLDKMTELGREPLYADVQTACRLGGFEAALPLTVAAMGSTDVANVHGPEIARAAARAGIVLGIGENVATVRGYDEPTTADQPHLKDRALAYLDALPDDGPGGLVFQQSVEDAEDELWNRIYSDPDLDPHIEGGRIGFEVKAGQGAKPGLGGAIRMDAEEARDLERTYHVTPTGDPGTVERHSAPGTYTEDILLNHLRLLQNNYPRARIWLKTAPYRDLDAILRVAREAGIDAVTLDGAEAGTAMAPQVTLRDSGLPTLACLAGLRRTERTGDLTVLQSGGIRTGADVVKSLALGADGCAAGRLFVEAAMDGGADAVTSRLARVTKEIRMLSSSVGKYDVAELSGEDVGALDRDTARALGVRWTMEA